MKFPNIFTRYFKCKGIQNTKDDENMAPPDDEGMYGHPFRDQEVIEPPPPKTKLSFYEREGSRKSWWLAGIKSCFVMAFILTSMLWLTNRALVMYELPLRFLPVMGAMFIIWATLYLRVKRVPVEE